MDYLTWAKDFFAKDVYATETTGIEILDVDKQYAKCRLDIESKHLNAGNVVMGGAIFTLADFTFAIASNVGNDLTVTVSSNICFLKPAKGDSLYAIAKCQKDGRKICYYDVEIFDDNDNIVARATTIGAR